MYFSFCAALKHFINFVKSLLSNSEDSVRAFSLDALFKSLHLWKLVKLGTGDKQNNLSLPSSVINTWMRYVLSVQEVWLFISCCSFTPWLSASVEARWWAGVGGGPMAVPGKPCQVQVAWTEPRTANGKWFCGACQPFARAATATRQSCRQCQQRDSVFYMHMHI